MIADGHFRVPTPVDEPVRPYAPGDAIGRPGATIRRRARLAGPLHEYSRAQIAA